MSIIVTSDEGGIEYAVRESDYPGPEEPLCWEHHSNVCGCPEEIPTKEDVDPSTGKPYAFSTEPPFPPDAHGPTSGIDLDLPLR